MKSIILDATQFMMLKIVLGMYILLSSLDLWLAQYHLDVNFAYLGLLGQLLSLLVGIRNSLQPANAKVTISLRVVLLSLTELVIGPTIAMFAMSYIYNGTVTTATGITAILIGAFWEIVWKFAKDLVNKKTKQFIENDTDLTKTTDDGGEPPKGGGQ
jgi:FtsH-binding integral membrane protein